MTILYHSTNRLELILDDGRLYAYRPAHDRSRGVEIKKFLQDKTVELYNRETSEMAEVARKKLALMIEKLSGSSDERSADEAAGYARVLACPDDENVADYALSMGFGRPADMHCQERYNELTRICHVWLGKYDVVKHIHGSRKRHMLELDVPEEKIRKSSRNYDQHSLVWWELSLEHLTRVLTTDHLVADAREKLDDHGLNHVEAISISDFERRMQESR